MLICPKQPYVLVDRADPTKRMPLPCGRYACETCRPAKINERVRVMAFGAAYADRVRMVTLTQLPATWQQARGQVRDFARRVRKAYRFEWAWAIEENPRLTGYHLHALQWGEYVPQRRLSQLWGGRRVWIDEVKSDAGGYFLKCAKVGGYMSKHIGLHLDINGGRALHMSRGYLHGLTTRLALQAMASGRSFTVQHATAEEKADDEARRWEDQPSTSRAEADTLFDDHPRDWWRDTL